MTREDFEEYINTLPYQLQKYEVIMDGPNTRFVDGVTTFFDEKNIKILIHFSKKTAPLALYMFELMMEPSLALKKIEINGNIIKNNPTTARNLCKCLDEIFPFINDENTIVLYPENDRIFYYERGCLIYKIYPDMPEEYFLEKKLET